MARYTAHDGQDIRTFDVARYKLLAHHLPPLGFPPWIVGRDARGTTMDGRDCRNDEGKLESGANMPHDSLLASASGWLSSLGRTEAVYRRRLVENVRRNLNGGTHM
jgi:hypothetical protein